MSSKNKSLTVDNLKKKQQYYHSITTLIAILIAVVFFFGPFIYIFLYAAYNGYGGHSPIEFFQSWTWLSNLSYSEASIETPFWKMFSGYSFVEFFKSVSFLRFLVGVAIIAMTIVFPIIYVSLVNIAHRKHYSSLYLSTVTEIASHKDIEIVIENKDDTIEVPNLDGILNIAGAIDAQPSSKITVSDHNISWSGVQVTYNYQGKIRNGYLLVTPLNDPKDLAFIQLRNYGRPIIANFEDIPLERYGFADNNLLNRFVCYAAANQNVYHYIDEKTAHSIFDLQNFLSSSLAISVANNTLSVFIDGFKLRIDHPLKEKVRDEVIDEEVKTLAVLNNLLLSLAACFSKDKVKESVPEETTVE